VLRLPDIALGLAASDALKALQDTVDAAGDYAVQIAKGKSLFDTRNKKTDPVFSEVRKTLATMSGGVLRCCYCELSEIDQVEHVFPKDLFPERCFKWDNYLYACGPCNRRKSNRWWTLDPASNTVALFTRQRGVPPTRPPELALMINPRVENPLDYLFLDTIDTFNFEPIADAPGLNRFRAEKTIELLELNREAVRVARMAAFDSYTHILGSYAQAKIAEESAQQAIIKKALLRQPHPTVWEFMKLHRSYHQSLDSWFSAAPETLDWTIVGP
jgi:uncharacterized protein (TIGR02646 family)